MALHKNFQLHQNYEQLREWPDSDAAWANIISNRCISTLGKLPSLSKRKTLRRRWALVFVDQLLYECRVQVRPDLYDGFVREAGYPAVPVVEGLPFNAVESDSSSTTAVSPSTRRLLTRKTTPSLRSLSSRAKVCARKFSFVW